MVRQETQAPAPFISLNKAEKAALTRLNISIKKVSLGDEQEMQRIYNTLHQIAINPVLMHTRISAEDEQYLENIRNSYEQKIAQNNNMEHAS